MSRTLSRGQQVTFTTTKRNPLAPASQNRAVAHLATLVRPYPGGTYDSGDMWVVSINDREAVAPISESMMVSA